MTTYTTLKLNSKLRPR